MKLIYNRVALVCYQIQHEFRNLARLHKLILIDVRANASYQAGIDAAGANHMYTNIVITEFFRQ